MTEMKGRRQFLKNAVVAMGGVTLFGLSGSHPSERGLVEGTGVRLQTADGGVLTCHVNFVEEPGEWEGCLYWNINSETPTVNTPAEMGRKEYFLKKGDHFYIADTTGKWQEVFFPSGKVVPERPEGFVRAMQEINTMRMR